MAKPLPRVYVDFSAFSDKTPTWVELSRVRAWKAGGGRDSELDDMDERGMQTTIGDRSRNLDPTNASASHQPNLVSNRRIRIDVQQPSGTVTSLFGKMYIDGWGPSWPDQSGNDQEARIRATDGRKILSMDRLPAATPDVLDYPDVISADEPNLYYRLGESAGTKAIHHVRKKRKRREGESRRHYKKHGFRRWVTREAEGMSGPAGTYKNTPLLGQPGGILGDPSTSVLFRPAQNEYARIVLDDDDAFNKISGLTVECWAKANWTTTTTDGALVRGPLTTGAEVFIFNNGAGGTEFTVRPSGGPGAVADSGGVITDSTAGWTHFVGTWDGAHVKLYIDAVEIDSVSGPATLESASANAEIWIGRIGGTYADGWIQDVAIYEHALSAERIAAHYEAAFLGFDAGTVDERIADILSFFPGEWTPDLRPAQRDLPPERYAGRGPLEMIEEAVDSEGIPAMFFFSKAGEPTFLDADHRSSPPWSDDPYWVFANGLAGLFPFDALFPADARFPEAAIPFETLEVSDTDDFHYNEVRVTSSEDYTATASDATSISDQGRKVLSRDDLEHASNADADAYAAQLLAHYKDPMIRIKKIRINSGNTEALQAMLDLELGDKVQIILEPPIGGDPLNQTSYVEFLEMGQDAPGEPIRADIGVSPR